jgi:hypothetical protein
MGSKNKTAKTKVGKNGKDTSVPAGVISGVTGPLKDQFCGRFKDAGICLAIFLSALFVIITISNPGLYLNDESITVNQVHQLNIGHQVTLNEGKYGVFKNGTLSIYYASRNNILMYSVALPLASMPAMKLIDLFGDNFRLALILFWAVLPFLISLIISWCSPEYAKIGSIRITVLGAAAGLLLFAANLIVYTPFIYSAPDAPIEVASVVFTNHLFFALTIVMTYLIARQIFNGRWKALLAALTVAASSAYLFWGANAKDHMATAAIFAVMLYFFVRYIRSRDFKDAACGFLSIGILAWFRPEVGFSAFFCMGLFIIADTLLLIRQKRETHRSGIIHISAILFTAIGSIPFFINNLVISGNPLVPAFLLEEKIKYGSTIVSIAPVAPVANSSHIVSATPVTIVSDLMSTLEHYIFSVSPNPLADFYGILFFPKSDSMGLFFIVPIALLALILIPLFVIRKKNGEMPFIQNKGVLLILLVTAFSVFLAYIHDLHGLNASTGIGPDIRYLSPVYIPAVLLSLMFLEKTILLAHPKILVKRISFFGILLVPVLLITLLMLHITVSNDLLLFNILILAEVFGIAGLTVIYQITRRKGNNLSDFCIPVLVLTILSWQVMMIIIISPIAKFNGYTFWIPGIDALYHHFIMVTTAP